MPEPYISLWTRPGEDLLWAVLVDGRRRWIVYGLFFCVEDAVDLRTKLKREGDDRTIVIKSVCFHDIARRGVKGAVPKKATRGAQPAPSSTDSTCAPRGV